MKKQTVKKRTRTIPYINRELSWLAFNRRVLEEAEDETNPLFERLKFISIFCNNLDEFFMVRVGVLHDLALSKKVRLDNKTKMTPNAQLRAIFEQTSKLIPIKDRAYARIMRGLKEAGVNRLNVEKLSATEEKYLASFFKTQVLPFISPQIVDKRTPFPFLKNLELYVGVQLSGGKQLKFGIVPIPEQMNRVVRVPGRKLKYCLLEEVICHFAEKIFKKYTIVDRTVFKITRNADIDISEGLFDEDVDYRDAMKELLKTRRKLCAVKLDIYHHINSDLMNYICDKLELKRDQVFTQLSPLKLSHVFSLEQTVGSFVDERNFFAPFTGKPCKYIAPNCLVMGQLRTQDALLHFPYNSMDDFIRLLHEAAEDIDVLSIKITLYRVADNSKVIDALIKAADNGKDVMALVELRARFDEANNINWAERLETAGVTVLYGHEELKTHSKICLITRKTDEGVEYFTQVGTGNYNEKTAKQYTDLSLITHHQGIGSDAAAFFQNIAMDEVTPDSKHLLIAPANFKLPIVRMIGEQIALAKRGKPAQIIFKVNSLTEKTVIDKLIAASQAGVKIKLIVRGMCCLKPSLKGVSENISVISIVGRFLEHSRIYMFGAGEDAKIYISSGDMMTRSVKNRIEISAPIYDPQIKADILGIISLILKDNVKARTLQVGGRYKHKKRGDINSQEEFLK